MRLTPILLAALLVLPIAFAPNGNDIEQTPGIPLAAAGPADTSAVIYDNGFIGGATETVGVPDLTTWSPELPLWILYSLPVRSGNVQPPPTGVGPTVEAARALPRPPQPQQPGAPIEESVQREPVEEPDVPTGPPQNVEETQLPDSLQQFAQDQGIDTDWVQYPDGEYAGILDNGDRIFVSPDGSTISILPELPLSGQEPDETPLRVYQLQNGDYEEVQPAQVEDVPGIEEPAPQAPAEEEEPLFFISPGEQVEESDLPDPLRNALQPDTPLPYIEQPEVDIDWLRDPNTREYYAFLDDGRMLFVSPDGRTVAEYSGITASDPSQVYTFQDGAYTESKPGEAPYVPGKEAPAGTAPDAEQPDEEPAEDAPTTAELEQQYAVPEEVANAMNDILEEYERGKLTEEQARAQLRDTIPDDQWEENLDEQLLRTTIRYSPPPERLTQQELEERYGLPGEYADEAESILRQLQQGSLTEEEAKEQLKTAMGDDYTSDLEQQLFPEATAAVEVELPLLRPFLDLSTADLAKQNARYEYDPETEELVPLQEGEQASDGAVVLTGGTANMLAENGFVYDEDANIWYTPETEAEGVRQQEIMHVGDNGEVDRAEQIQVTEDDEGNPVEEQTIVQTFEDGEPTTTTTTTETDFNELGEAGRTLEIEEDHNARETTFEETVDGETTKYQVKEDGGVAQWDPEENKWVAIDPAAVPGDLRRQIVDSAVGYNPKLSRAGIEWRSFLRWLGATVSGYEQYQAGFSQVSSLVGLEDEYDERWTEKINDFCLFGGLSSCFESAICGSLKNLGITDYDLVQEGTLTTPGRAAAHIEGDRSTGFETGEGTKYYYRFTFGFVNDADQERDVHVEFTGPNSQYFTDDETVAAGGSLTFINHNALISDSHNYYDKICLVWNPAMDTYGMLQPRRENQICNSLGPAEGYSEAEYAQQEEDEEPEEDEGIQLGEGF